jgi:hypothetical protein
MINEILHKLRLLLKIHNFIEKNLKSEFSKELYKYNILLIQKTRNKIFFFHRGRIVAYINEQSTGSLRTLFLLIFIYEEERVAPKSEYDAFTLNSYQRYDDLIDILINQNIQPVYTTEKYLSYSKMHLISAFINWWKDWSNSGRAIYEKG